jgi:hypothetical protein
MVQIAIKRRFLENYFVMPAENPSLRLGMGMQSPALADGKVSSRLFQVLL